MATKPAAETASQQVQSMQRLAQSSAAWALGMSPRSLRDHPDVPRAADGTYDVRSLVDWARGRGKVPALTSDQYEQVLLLVEKTGQDAIDATFRPIKRLIAELMAGGASETEAVAAVFGTYWNELRAYVGINPASFALGPDRIPIVMVCESCRPNRYRYGREWLEREPADGLRLLGAECPECLDKLTARLRARRPTADELIEELDDESSILPPGKRR